MEATQDGVDLLFGRFGRFGLRSNAVSHEAAIRMTRGGVQRRGTHTPSSLITPADNPGATQTCSLDSVFAMGRRALRPGEATAVLSLRLPASDREALDALGVFHGTSAAAEVRAAIDRYLDDHSTTL